MPFLLVLVLSSVMCILSRPTHPHRSLPTVHRFVPIALVVFVPGLYSRHSVSTTIRLVLVRLSVSFRCLRSPRSSSHCALFSPTYRCGWVCPFTYQLYHHTSRVGFALLGIYDPQSRCPIICVIAWMGAFRSFTVNRSSVHGAC